MDFLEKVKSVIIGHAVGDALGVPVEFMSREELKEKPVIGMQGYGTYCRTSKRVKQRVKRILDINRFY